MIVVATVIRNLAFCAEPRSLVYARNAVTQTQYSK